MSGFSHFPRQQRVLDVPIACKSHASSAMNMIGKAVGNIDRVPDDVKLPKPEDN